MTTTFVDFLSMSGLDYGRMFSLKGRVYHYVDTICVPGNVLVVCYYFNQDEKIYKVLP